MARQIASSGYEQEMHDELKSIAEKTKMVVYDTCGTCVCDVSEELKNQPCLNDGEILEIVGIAKDVEAHFGAPQDMEWVVDKRFSFRRAFSGSRPGVQNMPRRRHTRTRTM